MKEFDALLAEAPSRKGILARLRERYPNKVWKAVREGFGWGYETEDGWHAGWRSCLAPQYPDDDDTFVSRFFIYRPNEPTEEVNFT